MIIFGSLVTIRGRKISWSRTGATLEYSNSCFKKMTDFRPTYALRIWCTQDFRMRCPLVGASLVTFSLARLEDRLVRRRRDARIVWVMMSRKRVND